MVQQLQVSVRAGGASLPAQHTLMEPHLNFASPCCAHLSPLSQDLQLFLLAVVGQVLVARTSTW